MRLLAISATIPNVEDVSLRFHFPKKKGEYDDTAIYELYFFKKTIDEKLYLSHRLLPGLEELTLLHCITGMD